MSRLFYKLAILMLGAQQSRKELLRENEELKSLVRQMVHKPQRPVITTGFRGILIPHGQGIYLKSERLRKEELMRRWESRLQARIALKASKIQARATLIAGVMTLSTIVFTYLMSRNDAALKQVQSKIVQDEEMMKDLEGKVDVANELAEEERGLRRQTEVENEQLSRDLIETKLERDVYKLALLQASASWMGGIFHRWTENAESSILKERIEKVGVPVQDQAYNEVAASPKL